MLYLCCYFERAAGRTVASSSAVARAHPAIGGVVPWHSSSWAPGGHLSAEHVVSQRSIVALPGHVRFASAIISAANSIGRWRPHVARFEVANVASQPRSIAKTSVLRFVAILLPASVRRPWIEDHNGWCSVGWSNRSVRPWLVLRGNARHRRGRSWRLAARACQPRGRVAALVSSRHAPDSKPCGNATCGHNDQRSHHRPRPPAPVLPGGLPRPFGLGIIALHSARHHVRTAFVRPDAFIRRTTGKRIFLCRVPCGLEDPD